MTITRILAVAGFILGSLSFIGVKLPVSLLGFSANKPGASEQQQAITSDNVEGHIRDYLLENPEIMIEVQDILIARQQEEESRLAREAIAQSSDALLNNASDIIIGAPDASVTIVEFFDYNCGYCKRAVADMQAVLETDKDVKFILKEFPILGPASQDAHKVSIAVGKIAPDKIADFHIELISSSGRATKDSAMKLAENMGIDMDALNAKLDEPDLLGDVGETFEIAEALGIQGTPAYVIGDEMIPGAVGVDGLQQRIAALRSQ